MLKTSWRVLSALRVHEEKLQHLALLPAGFVESRSECFWKGDSSYSLCVAVVILTISILCFFSTVGQRM